MALSTPRHSYSDLRPADRSFPELVRDYFGAAVPRLHLDGVHVDVATGPNIYPALALPAEATIERGEEELHAPTLAARRRR